MFFVFFIWCDFAPVFVFFENTQSNHNFATNQQQQASVAQKNKLRHEKPQRTQQQNNIKQQNGISNTKNKMCCWYSCQCFAMRTKLLHDD